MAEYQAQITEIPPESIVYVDETGIDTFYTGNMAGQSAAKRSIAESAARSINSLVLWPENAAKPLSHLCSIMARWTVTFLNTGLSLY